SVLLAIPALPPLRARAVPRLVTGAFSSTIANAFRAPAPPDAVCVVVVLALAPVASASPLVMVALPLLWFEELPLLLATDLPNRPAPPANAWELVTAVLNELLPMPRLSPVRATPTPRSSTFEVWSAIDTPPRPRSPPALTCCSTSVLASTPVASASPVEMLARPSDVLDVTPALLATERPLPRPAAATWLVRAKLSELFPIAALLPVRARAAPALSTCDVWSTICTPPRAPSPPPLAVWWAVVWAVVPVASASPVLIEADPFDVFR